MKQNTQSTDPKIFFDKEEKELFESVARGEWEMAPNQKKEVSNAQSLARASLRKSKSISIRLTSGDLVRIKAKAIREGLPYQTLITSLIHQYAHKE